MRGRSSHPGRTCELHVHSKGLGNDAKAGAVVVAARVDALKLQRTFGGGGVTAGKGEGEGGLRESGV